MKRLLFALIGILLLGSQVFAVGNTYYISADGDDDNDGYTGCPSNTPGVCQSWVHTPGMYGCSGNCLKKYNGTSPYSAPEAGDRFILKGGNSWHFSGNVTPFWREIISPYAIQWMGT